MVRSTESLIMTLEESIHGAEIMEGVNGVEITAYIRVKKKRYERFGC